MRGELILTEDELKKAVEDYLNSRISAGRTYDTVDVYHIRPCGTQANPNEEYCIGVNMRIMNADSRTI